MRPTLTLVVLFIISLSSYSQDSSFRLKDYKYRTDGYRSLNLTASIMGSYYENDYNDTNRQNYSRSDWRFFPVDISYYTTYNHDNRIHTTAVYLGGSYTTTKTKNDGLVTRTKYLPASFYLYNEDLFYRGKNFLETAGQLTGDLFLNKNNDTASRFQSNQKLTELTLTVGAGRGRIENVRDAQMAIFILNDLENQGLLSSHPDAHTYNELASLITQINNKRIFDNRVRRIYELSQIDSFIRDKGLVANTDIRHFTTINDNWSLAFNPGRYSGTRWFARLKPGAGLDYYDTENEIFSSNSNYDDNTRYVFAGGEIGIVSFKARSLHWQHNWKASISARHEWNLREVEADYNGQVIKSEYHSNIWSEEGNIYYGIEYFPNNRTILGATFEVTGGHNSFYNYTQTGWQVTPRFGFNTDYFLGYRTRLYCNLSIYKNYYSNSAASGIPDATDLYSSVSMGIAHTIF